MQYLGRADGDNRLVIDQRPLSPALLVVSGCCKVNKEQRWPGEEHCGVNSAGAMSSVLTG